MTHDPVVSESELLVRSLRTLEALAFVIPGRLVLVVTAMVAGLVPVLRAVRVDPTGALRGE